MRALRAGVFYFALVFGAGFVLGSVRVPFLVPRLGVRVAELIETPFMLVAIVLSARYVIRRFDLPQSRGIRLAVGLLALAMLVIAELAVALVVQQQSLAQYIAGRDPVSGLYISQCSRSLRCFRSFLCEYKLLRHPLAMGEPDPSFERTIERLSPAMTEMCVQLKWN